MPLIKCIQTFSMHLLWKKCNTPSPYSTTNNVFYRAQKPYMHALLILFSLLNKILPLKTSHNICRVSWKLMWSLRTIMLHKTKSKMFGQLVSWKEGQRVATKSGKLAPAFCLPYTAFSEQTAKNTLNIHCIASSIWTFPPRLTLHASTKNKHISHTKRNHSDKKQSEWKGM